MLKCFWNSPQICKMAEHADLIAELPLVEKMTTQERLKNAKKRRANQLKMWSQREKDFTSKRNKIVQNLKRQSKKFDYKVHFDPNVMLLEAAARNDVAEVQRLLFLGVDPDSTNEDGLTALHQCCIDASEELMTLLVDFGANVNAEDSEKWTPLHAAATCGHLNLAKYLINKGANLLAVNGDGNMPYDICEDEKTLDYIESEMAKRGITQQLIDDTRAATEMQMLDDLHWLIEGDGDLDSQDDQGATYLHIASANGYISAAEFLLKNGANPSVIDNDSWQPVHAAACWGHPEILEMLVQHGADIDAETRNGETPFDICEDPDLRERIQELKNELEIQRSAQQMTRLRRSQSQNTRSHSVRRTSLRDKSQISWKEAREEAKLRLEKQDKLLPNVPVQNQVKKMDDEIGINDKRVINVDDISLTFTAGEEENRQLQIESNHKNNKDKQKIDAMLDAKTNSGDYSDSKRTDHENLKSYENGDRTHSNSSNRRNVNADANTAEIRREGLGSSATAFAVSQSQTDLKVDLNIHVTLNTGSAQYNSNGTLADLKRHRSDLRSRTNSIISSSQEYVPLHDQKLKGLESDNANMYALSSPPSPSTNRQKYYETSEIVGASEKQGCCRIM